VSCDERFVCVVPPGVNVNKHLLNKKLAGRSAVDSACHQPRTDVAVYQQWKVLLNAHAVTPGCVEGEGGIREDGVVEAIRSSYTVCRMCRKDYQHMNAKSLALICRTLILYHFIQAKARFNYKQWSK
jgi:hypothetical protein